MLFSEIDDVTTCNVKTFMDEAILINPFAKFKTIVPRLVLIQHFSFSNNRILDFLVFAGVIELCSSCVNYENMITSSWRN